MNTPGQQDANKGGKEVRLNIRLDAGGVEDFTPDQEVRVLARYSGRKTLSAEASDEELQALRQGIPRRLWEGPGLTLPTIPVPACWWTWRRRWCRTFTVHGRVVCALMVNCHGIRPRLYSAVAHITFMFATRSDSGRMDTSGVRGRFEAVAT